jgi:hypothetical protein
MENLLDKIRKIEALIQGATTTGEKSAAILAKKRVQKRIASTPKIVEYRLYTQDNWHKKLLLALCRKYGIEPYRYSRQKYTTVMVRIDEEFLKNVLWKEYLDYSKHLEILVEEITDNLIEKIHAHEEESVVQKKYLGS